MIRVRCPVDISFNSGPIFIGFEAEHLDKQDI